MSKSNSRKANIALWTVQVILAGMFLFAGGMKLVVPFAVLSKQMPAGIPAAFLHTIGVLELLGGLGMIVPGLFRLRSSLTPLAAGGLVIIMSGAIGVSITSGPFSMAAIPFAVGVLAAIVAYGRTRIVPLRENARHAVTRSTADGSILHRAA